MTSLIRETKINTYLRSSPLRKVCSWSKLANLKNEKKDIPLPKNIFGKRSIKNDKNEVAFTSIINHDLGKINPKQYFMKEGPLAILPINDKKFSLIWSMSDKYSKLQKNEFKDSDLVVVIFPDHGSRYLSKIYSDKWMENQGFSDSKHEINNNDIQYIRK